LPGGNTDIEQGAPNPAPCLAAQILSKEHKLTALPLLPFSLSPFLPPISSQQRVSGRNSLTEMGVNNRILPFHAGLQDFAVQSEKIVLPLYIFLVFHTP
jgi:hypothetical protein